ncbi:MAG: hypothetical protein ACE5K7_08415, partial [Phycisphaerae bacterium]
MRDLDEFTAHYGSGSNVAGQYSGSLNNAGEKLLVQLPDPLPLGISRFAYESFWYPTTDGGGYSLVIRDPAAPLFTWNQAAGWQVGSELGGSPGRADGQTLDPDLRINEALTHTDLPQTDTIELHNPTAGEITVGTTPGYEQVWLSDSRSDYCKFEVPAGTVIPAGGFVTFDESNFNPGGGTLPGDFALDGAHGESLYLTTGDGTGRIRRFLDDVSFPAAANTESFARFANAAGRSYFYPSEDLTLGQDNTTGGNGPRVGPLVVSELNYSPLDTNLADTVDAGDLEYVEIHNPTDSPVELARWFDANGNSQRDQDLVNHEVEPWHLSVGQNDFVFPLDGQHQGVILPAHGTLLVLAFNPQTNNQASGGKLKDFCDAYGIGYTVNGDVIVPDVPMVGGYSGNLSNEGELVTLWRPDEPPTGEPQFFPLIVEDQADYDEQTPWPEGAAGTGDSLHRAGPSLWGNQPTSFTAAAPSPDTVAFSPVIG